MTLHSPRLVYLAVLCGLVSSILYAAMLVVVPTFWDGYSSASQTVSELSAVGSPTRPIWVPLGVVYGLLVAAFGWGVWMSAGASRPLRLVGGLMIANALFGATWPSMHQREVLAAGGGTLTDAMHIVWTGVTNVLFLLQIGFAAAALSKGFRAYSIVTAVLLLAFGTLTGLDAPNMEANLPTPWMGIWERIAIGAFMIWVSVLAIAVLRRLQPASVTAGRHAAAA